MMRDERLLAETKAKKLAVLYGLFCKLIDRKWLKDIDVDRWCSVNSFCYRLSIKVNIPVMNDRSTEKELSSNDL